MLKIRIVFCVVDLSANCKGTITSFIHIKAVTMRHKKQTYQYISHSVILGCKVDVQCNLFVVTLTVLLLISENMCLITET